MDFKKLLAYQKSFDLSMDIFEVSKSFPKEETYSLISQIRRSFCSVFAHISESYRKRLYPGHFVSKLTDADAENSETFTWLEFALACKYIDDSTFQDLNIKSLEIG
ncbi:four helix bundle protein [Gelidibacter sp.]|uniref:four helix bundle protein n=1 Tax=Gelidibacter sp. TaxID=2018083 RepID=UPI002B524270|nr:four helix bundle protein [Gelidibacter sp.]HUH28012.1 four helix bundle protein [Gelidibacter sp.]